MRTLTDLVAHLLSPEYQISAVPAGEWSPRLYHPSADGHHADGCSVAQSAGRPRCRPGAPIARGLHGRTSPVWPASRSPRMTSMSHSVESAREEQPPRSSTESIEVSYVQSNRQARLISSSKT